MKRLAQKLQDRRGASMLMALLLFLDLRFPLLFWNLRHGLEVSGGEPTGWYYSMQRVGRITDIVGIFVLAALSFALH